MPFPRPWFRLLVLSLSLSLAACNSSPAGPDLGSGVDVLPDHPAPDLPAVVDGGLDLGSDVAPDAAAPPDLGPLSDDCDPLNPELCSLPWPSNLYLQPDTTTATGYRLKFGPTTLPANRTGVHVDPAAYTHLDGYAVSTPIMVLIPNVDPANLPSENQIDASMADGSPVALFESDAQGNLTRLPCFAELDSNEGRPDKQVLFIRPAVILKEATRYVVALSGLNDTLGAPMAPGPAFTALRDGTMTGNAQLDAMLEPRRARFQQIVTQLSTAGLQTADLFLAWDFVTASSEALHGRLLSMRDDAITTVGDQGPPLTVTSVTEFVPSADGSGRTVDPDIALEVQGTFHVPSYLKPHPGGGGNSSELNLDSNGVPQQNGTRDPTFLVRIPYSALNGGPPHGLVEYGHGLLGDATEVRGDFIGTICNQNNLIYFAANLTGMDIDNIAAVVDSLEEVSQFVTVADPLHQGIIEWVLLARAMRAQLAGLPELAMYNITTNPDELFYSGISQGGIFGGTLVAVSPDIDRGHLGVPGNNYSLLLGRSHDFDRYLPLLKANYPSTADRAVLLATLQLLWESTDPVSHFRHMTVDPYPGNNPKQVLLAPAKGDYQVAVISNEILARSGLGISMLTNYDDERMPYGIDQVSYPLNGSGIVLYDFGNNWPSPGNLPPADDPAGDPHEKPRRAAWHNMQLVNFLRTGNIIDVCGGDGCHPQ